MGQYDPEVEESISSETGEEVDEPPMYKVMLLNDDYTTMEFVVEVLVYVFKKSADFAAHIPLNRCPLSNGPWKANDLSTGCRPSEA